MARLKEQYKAEVAPALYKKFGYKSTMQIPKIDKVVVNVGCGEAKENAKVLEAVVRDLTTITGQKAVVTKAKKSIANFKLREDMPIGAKVTLRGDKMWEFLDRLFNVELPRPDLVLFLDMPTEISQRLLSGRYAGDERKKDLHESNVEFLTRCRRTALYAAEAMGWHTVSCSQEGAPRKIEDIQRDIREIVSQKL